MRVKSNSIFTSLILNYIVLIFFVFLIIYIFSYFIIKEININYVIKEAKSNIILLEEFIKNDLKSNDYSLLNEQLSKYSKKINKRITIINKTGRVIADSEEDYKTMDNLYYWTEVFEALNGKTGISTRYDNKLKKYMLYISLSLTVNNESYIYMAGYIMEDIIENIKSFHIKVFIICSCLFFLSAAFILMISKKISSPINKLTVISSRLVRGELNEIIYFKNAKKEIKILIKNFNIMAFKLKNQFNEQSREKEELNSIISSIKEGIIVTDMDGKISMANSSFLKIINKNDARDKYCWEVIRNTEIIDFIMNNEIKNEKNSIKEIIFENRIYYCSMNQLDSKNGFVFIFSDITELKNLENIKKDFVSNVSHELKTPLTSIIGFTEMLVQEEKDIEKKRCLDIIYRNSNRLINIINDLLMLSKLENDKKNQIEKIEIKKFTNNIFNIFENKLNKKKLKLNVKIIPDFIESDPFKLEQIFINLIDNAVKYTDKGEINIFIHEKNSSIFIEISDTGIGISEKDIGRIFERFYVSDKSRSKENGGTGLGLAIVKHNVIKLNGEIKVESRLGKGSIFTITLPKKY